MNHRMTVALLVVCLAAPAAFGWGAQGHRIVGRIAHIRLGQISPEARAEALRLLDVSFLSDVANDPDGWRERPGGWITYGWHFVNMTTETPDYDQARDCPSRACVTEQIELMKALVADRAQRAESRGDALKYLIHLVGDIHQPFHNCSRIRNGRSDNGANGVPVEFPASGNWNLHRVWDSGLIGDRMLSDSAYTQHLLNDVLGDRDSDQLAGGTPQDWTNAAHDIAVDAYVEPDETIDRGYIDEHQPHVDEQLLLAGLRLARLIEEALRED